MKGNKSAVTSWITPAAPPPVIVDDGDVCAPLRAVRDSYLTKALQLEESGKDPAYMLRAAAAITRMLDSPTPVPTPDENQLTEARIEVASEVAAALNLPDGVLFAPAN